MEPVFALFEAWWWAAPAAIGLGAVSYGALTTGRRRQRRLEVDAARREVAVAHTAIVVARADARAARARMLTAQARPARGSRFHLRAGGLPGAADGEARAARGGDDAPREAHGRERRSCPHGRGGSRPPAAPLAALMTRHDAVTARWLDYETDVAKLIAYPQMTDARHPSTAAFLVRRAEASRLRPASARARVTAVEFAAYRDAVYALEAAFAVAEQDARRSVPRG